MLDLYLMMATGCTLHLLSTQTLLFPAILLEYLRAYEITLLFFAPSFLASISSLDMFSEYALPSLKKILFAGEVMPVPVLKYFRRHFPDALLSNLYGPTEITVDALYWIAGNTESLEKLESVPLGHPCENTSIVLVDDNGELVEADDVVAEICVGGAGVALGYWKDVVKTSEVFVQHPGHNSYRDIVYKTGDLGYRSSRDGCMYFSGRIDHQFKHQGYCIEAGEIEAALQLIEGMHQCCVQYDAVHPEIVAFHPPVDSYNAQRFQGELADRLPAYMIPRRYIACDHFPVTTNGKIDRTALWNSYLKSRNG